MLKNLANSRRLTVIAAAAFVLAACSGLTQSDKPAVNVWWLQPLAGAARPEATPVPLLMDLDVVPGLDSDKILALGSDAQLKPYAGARWADDLPALAGSLVSRSLQASGRFEVLQHGRAGATVAGCELRLEISEFFADLEAGGRTRGVSVAIGGQYRCGADDAQALASRASVGVSDERMSVIVAAFQEALDKVTQNIINNISIKQ